jgi:RNA polymerase sigma factor (sigma-70 family)
MGVMAEAVDLDLTGIVASAAAGDEIAFGRIVRTYHGEMLRICLAISRDQAIADEAVQSAWSIAWRRIDSVREPDRLRPWLISVAVNEVRQHLRKRRKRADVEVPIETSCPPGGIDPATSIAYLDLQGCLERLDPDDRALLALRYVAGFDASELAQVVGISPAGVRTRLKRLLDRLRQDLSHG